jgi:hypothetical protein
LKIQRNIINWRKKIVLWLREVSVGLSELEFQKGQGFYLFHSAQTGSRAHPASYPMSTGGYFAEGKAAEA